MMGIISPSDSLAPTVCNQCKRRKKRCDKVLPACSRCCKLQIICQYAPEQAEPDRDAFSIGSSSCASGTPFSARSLPVASPFALISSLLDPSAGPLFPHDDAFVIDLDRQVTQHALDLITRNGDNVDSICLRYFELVEKWMPVVDKECLFERLGTLGSIPSASFSSLLLSICVFTEASTDQLDPRYFTSKVFLSLLQSSGRLSEELLQAQLLVAMYEFSQCLYERALLSIGICARIGLSMGLHRTLDSRIPLGTVPLKDIERKRRIWWCIIIFERVMNVSRNGEGKPFACPDPGPYDYFPLDSHDLQDIPKELKESTRSSLIVSQMTQSYSILLNSFTRLAQSVCLLQRVVGHIENNTISQELKHKNCIDIDTSVRAFTQCLLGEVGKRGDYCGPYSVTLIALQCLHQHHLMTETPHPTNIYALNTAEAMILEGASVSAEYQRIWDTMPFSTLHVVYLTVVGLIKFTRNYKDISLTEKIDIAKNYLKHWEGRWKISSDYLQAVDNLVALYYTSSPSDPKPSPPLKPEDLENEKIELERLTISKKPSSSPPSKIFESLDMKETGA